MKSSCFLLFFLKFSFLIFLDIHHIKLMLFNKYFEIFSFNCSQQHNPIKNKVTLYACSFFLFTCENHAQSNYVFLLGPLLVLLTSAELELPAVVGLVPSPASLSLEAFAEFPVACVGFCKNPGIRLADL